MRKATMIIFLGVAVAAVASVSTSIKWKSKILDLGQIEVGEVKALSFEFTNMSHTAVNILDAQGSCGCTQVTFPREEILPGETAFVTANFRSAKPGMFNKTIRIKTSESEAYTYLKFKGEAVD